jgi:hypothetical protein
MRPKTSVNRIGTRRRVTNPQGMAHTITCEDQGEDIMLSESLHPHSIKANLDESIASLTQWLRENSLDGAAHSHADEGAHERLSWHYGYLIALRDVRELLAAA